MDNLRSYLATCALPPMQIARNAPLPPPHGHKSHRNHLHVRPETWRRLETIYPLESGIECTIMTWIEKHIPTGPIDSSDVDLTDERLTIPCASVITHCLDMMKKPDSVLRMIPWLDSLPLQTVQSTIHIAFPQLLDWGFKFSNDPHDVDREIYQHFFWSTVDADSDTDFVNTLVVAFQPPWILSNQDIKDFSQCRSIPPFRKTGNVFPSTMNSQHRVWAKMWDVCVRQNSHWFVLTSYEAWVFGAFSEGWTAGFVTDVYFYDSFSPSIAECLTFWIASSMCLDESASMPTVAEPLGHRVLPVSVPSIRVNDFTQPTASESNWNGKDDEIESSAGVWSNLSFTESFASGLPGMPPPFSRHSLPSRTPHVTTWLASTADSLNPDCPTINPSTIGKQETEPNPCLGEWLV